MPEEFKSHENVPPTEREVVEAMHSKGVEDIDARELLNRYIEQLRRAAELEIAADPKNETIARRAYIRSNVMAAILYSKIDDTYKRYAEQILKAEDMNAFRPETEDLRDWIKELLKDLRSEK